MFEDYEFALCLTHDVDRPYKTIQAPYYALKETDPSHLLHLISSTEPYWQFENIMRIEEELGVRSSFYFLNEQRLFRERPFKELISPKAWRLYAGRYDITSIEIQKVIEQLSDGGWEVGLHGSYNSYDDQRLLRKEKETLEEITDDEIIGGRQHYLNLERPETWKYQKEAGLCYDSSLGSSESVGFSNGYQPLCPFEDEFMVFPLTVMEIAIMRGNSYTEAENKCKELLQEAAENNAVMTILWHPRFFNEDEFPGYKKLYIRTIEEAQEMSGWVGSCRDLYKQLRNHE